MQPTYTYYKPFINVIAQQILNERRRDQFDMLTQTLTGFPLTHLAGRWRNFRPRKIFCQNFLPFRALQLTPDWVIDHQLQLLHLSSANI